MRVAVVGAGAVGLTAAHDLAVGGATVTVYDRGQPGSGATGRAAGVLYDAYAEDVDAELGARAMVRFREFSGTGGFTFHECPYVMLARAGDVDVAAALPSTVERMRAHGRPVGTVSPEELGERFPALRTDDVAAAAVAENAGWTDPGDYVEMMAGRAREAGVDLRPNRPVGVDPEGPGVTTGAPGTPHAPGTGTSTGYDAVVVAAGAHTKEVLAAAGVRVPLKPYRVQALTARVDYGGPMCYDATAGTYLRPHPTGVLVGDGTVPAEADPDGWEREADDWFRAGAREVLAHRLDRGAVGHVRNPDAGTRPQTDDAAVERAWAGLCTATPDGDPLLGELRDGLYVAAGWQGHGFMRAPATGEAIAAQVLGDADGISPFDPGRFAGDEQFEIREGMAVRPERTGRDGA